MTTFIFVYSLQWYIYVPINNETVFSSFITLFGKINEFFDILNIIKVYRYIEIPIYHSTTLNIDEKVEWSIMYIMRKKSI